MSPEEALALVPHLQANCQRAKGVIEDLRLNLEAANDEIQLQRETIEGLEEDLRFYEAMYPQQVL